MNAKSTYTFTATTLTIRTTLSRTFTDNTYGSNTIGWPGSHKFNDMRDKDWLQIALYDANNVKKMEFKIDYFSTTTVTPQSPSGFKSLGVTGGQGSMILGNSSDVVAAVTSMDKNLNTNGPTYYLTSNSPATNASYTPNPSFPNWIYYVWYEVTVNLSAFGTAGFGTVDIDKVRSDPSKTGNNYELVNEVPCTSSIPNRPASGIRNVIVDLESETQLTMYPNPASEELNISFVPGKTGSSTIALYDKNGKLVSYLYNGVLEERKTYLRKIDTRLIPSGVYFVKFQNGEFIKTKKLVIAK